MCFINYNAIIMRERPGEKSRFRIQQTEGDISNNAVIQDNGEIIVDGKDIKFYEKINSNTEVRATAFQD